MDIRDSVLATIGNTPLVRLGNLAADTSATVAVKLEFFNPAGSVKDRAALSMIATAERDGSLRPGGTVVEATSGNTGFAVAMIAATKGYRAVIVCSDAVPREKIARLEAFGAKVVRVPAEAKPGSQEHFLETAKRIADETDNAIFANQAFNPANPEAHYRTTGPEIWAQTEGRVTVFVTSAGTGGTVTGVGRFLKERNPDIEIIVADPVGSIYESYVKTREIAVPAPYLVEAAGQNEPFIPDTFDADVVDRVVKVSDADSFVMARRLARREGIFSGMSGGLTVAVALRIAQEKEEDDLIVGLVPDAGDRYLPRLYAHDWLAEYVPEVIEREESESPDTSGRRSTP